MKKVPFKKINAFARGASTGNPAAVVTLQKSDDLTEEEMLQCAKELKGFVSEVAYIWPREAGGYRLRYFSSEREVAFCGHATIATMYDLLATTDVLKDVERCTIEVNSGELIVENKIASDDAVFIYAPEPTYAEKVTDRGQLAEALRCDKGNLSEAPITIINAGLETLIVPMADLDATLSVEPDLEELDKYCRAIGVDIMILWSDEVEYAENRYRTRVFAPTFGYLEDPATGSGNAAFANYLLQQKRWDGALLSIEQSGNRLAPNIVKLQAPNQQVLFGGGAVTQIEGHYYL